MIRLKEIQSILDTLTIQDYRLNSDYKTSGTYQISNINEFKIFLSIIEKVYIYDEQINDLRQSDLFTTSMDFINVSSDTNNYIMGIARYLINSTDALKRTFSLLLPEDKENSISVKLSDPSDFQSLIKTMEKFNKAISNIIVEEEIQGSVHINNWEYGSFWVELVLGSVVAVQVVSRLAWSGAVVYKKINEGKILAQTVRGMEIKNDSLEDILNAQKQMTTQLIETEANAIEDEFFNDKDNERIERVKHSIKMLAELIGDGVEVHPSLMAPEEVKNLFPDTKNLDSIMSKVKQIEDKSGDSE